MLKIAYYFNRYGINYDMNYVAESRAIKYSFVRHGYRVIFEAAIEELKDLDHSSGFAKDFIMDRCRIDSDLFPRICEHDPIFYIKQKELD